MSSNVTLKRTVGLPGAIFLGLGSILGTGVFVSLGLAVGIAGEWTLPALCLAGLLAICNALSSAQLAANHPVSGGTYAYGYRYLNPGFGFTAGLCFLLAKSASAAAAAIGLAGYVGVLMGWNGQYVNVTACLLVLVMTIFVVGGLRRASFLNAVLVGAALTALFGLILASVNNVETKLSLDSLPTFEIQSFFEASAFLFVAFTGYGRIATLGEEVSNPRRTIPRAIIVTLFVSTVFYFGVLYAGLGVLGAPEFASATIETSAPLQTIAAKLSVSGLRELITVGAVMAIAGVLLNLILGLSRVAFSMGREGDLPAVLGRVSAKQEPIVAAVCIGIFIALLALLGGLKSVWGFSAFAVLCYYAITNLAALRLSAQDRLYPRFISVLGLCGCLGLAIWITPKIIVICLAIIGIGLGLRYILRAV